jgi:hypothetical protein
VIVPPHLIAQIDQRYPDARAGVLDLVENVRPALAEYGAPVTSAILAAQVHDDLDGDAQQLAGMLGVALVELARHLTDEEVSDGA